MKLDKYEMLLLNIIGIYNEGNGIGAPTIDRLFYKKLSDEFDLDDIYSINWVSIMKGLTEKGLVQRVPSGKGEMISDKGREILKNKESQA